MNDIICFADSDSGLVDRTQGWLRGIRMCNAHDGRLIVFIPNSVRSRRDARGSIYGVDDGPKPLSAK